MDITNIIEILFSPFGVMAKKNSIDYLELTEFEEKKTFYNKIYTKDFISALNANVFENSDFQNKGKESRLSFDINSEKNESINCCTYPLKSKKGIYILILQSKSKLTEDAEKLIDYVLNVLAALIQKNDSENSLTDDKYKTEVNSQRDIQAKLFPKFDEIKEMDIRSAFLPVEFMSGTFIDAIFLDESTYQLTACDVSDYGPGSSFIGAAIRTIIRSDVHKKMVPSILISTIMDKIKNMMSGSASASNIYLTIYQISLKTGKISLSSYGSITTLFYIKKKNNIIDLASTQVGKQISNRNFLKDMIIYLEPGDSLLYYTRGIKIAKPENSENEYGVENIKKEMMENIESESIDIIHSIINSVYEFTDYAKQNEDLVLISMKRNV